MSFIIDTTESVEINLNPQTVAEEVLQNLWFLYSSIEYDVPLNRGFGLDATYIDMQIEAAKALIQADIYEKTENYEPRAEVINVSFETAENDAVKGKLKPIVEVVINGEYDQDNTG